MAAGLVDRQKSESVCKRTIIRLDQSALWYTAGGQCARAGAVSAIYQ